VLFFQAVCNVYLISLNHLIISFGLRDMLAIIWQVCVVYNLVHKLFSSVFDDVAVRICEKVLYKSCNRLLKLSNDVCHASFGSLKLELHFNF
jgi:hypothetical protein